MMQKDAQGAIAPCKACQSVGAARAVPGKAFAPNNLQIISAQTPEGFLPEFAFGRYILAFVP